MDKQKNGIRMLVIFCLFIGFIGITSIPITAKNESLINSVAEEMVGSSGISWAPMVNYEKLVLTVLRPDGTVFRKTFNSGSAPYLDLSSIYGDNSCDGSYTYELRVIPQQIKKSRGESTQKGPEQIGVMALTQTGHFLIKGGALVSKNLSETPASTMDVIHNDDVIITGSLCAGFDCVNGESFGFDTLILKENNLRLLFNDTSSTSGFPANDWRLTANDSASGGASYFSIDDATGSRTPFKIMAGARSNSIFVSSSGRLGLGTSTPVLNLHIVQGDTPSIRLDQDGSSGWTAQVWDIAGNESNFFIRDVTGGSKLSFRIQPGTPTNTLCLKSDGKVGIGTWSPDYPIELETPNGTNAVVACTQVGGAQNFMSATGSFGQFGTISNHPARIVVNSVWKFQLNADSSISMENTARLTAGGTWTNASSRALKENIQTLTASEAISTLNQLNAVKYNYKIDKDEKHVGFIAEDVPDLVASKDRKGMSPMDVVAVLTKVVQEQQNTIAELQKKIEKLEKK